MRRISLFYITFDKIRLKTCIYNHVLICPKEQQQNEMHVPYSVCTFSDHYPGVFYVVLLIRQSERSFLQTIQGLHQFSKCLS